MMRPLWIASAALTSVAVGGPLEIHFTPRTDAFRNPGQGWSAADASRWDELDAVVNVGAGYRRYDWKTLEPKEGQYAWEVIDRDLEFYARKGLAFSWPEGAVDLGGYPRLNGNRIDIGCYEAWIPRKGVVLVVR